MKCSAIHQIKVLAGVMFVVGWITEVVAQTANRTERLFGRPVYSTPDPRYERYSPASPPVYRPDVPVEQQHWYDRHAVGQTVG